MFKFETEKYEDEIVILAMRHYVNHVLRHRAKNAETAAIKALSRTDYRFADGTEAKRLRSLASDANHELWNAESLLKKLDPSFDPDLYPND